MNTFSNRGSSARRTIFHLGGREGEKGQAFVEVALTVPLLILLLLGAAELAQIAYAAIEVANAASAGVQYGAQNTITASDTAGIQTAAIDDAANLRGLTATSSYSCICSNGSPSTCLRTDCSTSNIEEILTVQTQATVGSPIHLPGLPSQFTLRGHAVQKVIQ